MRRGVDLGPRPGAEAVQNFGDAAERLTAWECSLLIGTHGPQFIGRKQQCKGYTKDVFLGLAARVRVRIYCALARNLALLAILISIRLVSAILYSRYNSRRTTMIKD